MMIFIDFDDVLFNTKKFRSDLRNLFFQNGISSEAFEKYYASNTFSSKTYDPWEHLNMIEKKDGTDVAKARRELEEFMVDTNPYLFDDSVDFLKEFEDCFVCIISYGEIKFQGMKIGECRVGRYCKEILITDEMKSHIMEKVLKSRKMQDEIFFIDDRVEQIEDVKTKLPFVKSILVKRPEGRYGDAPTELCDFVVGNLKEAVRVIKKVM